MKKFLAIMFASFVAMPGAIIMATASAHPVASEASYVSVDHSIIHRRHLITVHLEFDTFSKLHQRGKLAPLPVPTPTQAPAQQPPAASPQPLITSIGVLGPCEGIQAIVPVIACAAEWANIDFNEFLAVAKRESSLEPWVTSSTGCCHGLFQLHETYWADWVHRYTQLSWFGGIVPSYYDARANAIVAAAMWADQGGPCPAWC